MNRRWIGLTALVLLACSGYAFTQEQATYTVQKGDSLWKISGEALKNPLLWPSIWKANAYVTNPNRIYPGEILALPIACPPVAPVADAGSAGSETAATELVVEQTVPEREIYSFTPRVIAVSSGDAWGAGGDGGSGGVAVGPNLPIFLGGGFTPVATVLGSPEGAISIAPNLTVALDRGAAFGIASGERLWTLRKDRFITHPATGAPIGWLYRVVAEIEVICTSDQFSTAAIIQAYDAIHPGDLCIAPGEIADYPSLRPTFRDACLPDEIDLTAVLVAPVADKVGISSGDQVIIDRGLADGIEVGDRFVALQTTISTIGGGIVPVQAKPIGEIVVVATAEGASTGVVVASSRELDRGLTLALLP